MTTTPAALGHTSTDTLVTVLGDLRHSLGQVIRTAAGMGVIPPPESLLALDYVRAAAEVTELVDARLAQS